MMQLPDEKIIAMMLLTLIALAAMWFFKAESMNLISNIVSGILGMTIGVSIAGNGGQK